MKRRHTNLDGTFSVSSYCKSSLSLFGSNYELTEEYSDTTISLNHAIKIVFSNLNTLLNGKRITSGKLTCVFELETYPIVFTLKDEFENVIDIIETGSNSASIKVVNNLMFLSFDISSFLKNNATNTLYLYDNTPLNLHFYGFNYLDRENINSDSPLEYVQINEFYNYGKKDNNSFMDYDLGNAGIASVSLANGNLLFATPTLVGNLVKTSLNISLCYNSLRTNALTTGYGFRMTADWQFEILSNKHLLLIDSTGQELLFEKLTSTLKQTLLINSNNDIYFCAEDSSYIEVLDENSYRYHSPAKIEMQFSTADGTLLISSAILNDGSVLTYRYYENSPQLLKEVETPDDLISFEYENGLLTSIISNKKYLETTLEYVNGYLNSVKTYKKKYIPFANNQMSSELIRSLRLIYDSSTNLLIRTDNIIEHRRLQFIYDNGKIVTIKESPFDEELNLHDVRETDLTYSNNITSLTTQSNLPITYCFNPEQKLLYAIDAIGKVMNFNYQFSDDGIDGVISKISQYALSTNLQNLLVNGSFECSPVLSGWIASNSIVYEQNDDSVYGDYSVFLTNNSNSTEKIEQDIEISETDTYSFTGKYKIANSNVTGYTAKITIQYDEITYIWIPNGDSSGVYTLQETIIPRTIVQTAVFELNNNVWNSFEINNLNIPNEASVKIEVLVPPGGEVYLDEIILSKTNKVGTNNFVRNSNFETIDSQTNLPYSWTVSGTGVSLINSNSLIEVSSLEPVLQSKVLKFSSLSTPSQRTISQQLPVAGSAGEQLSVHAWIKGNNTINEKVKIVVKIHKVNGGSEDYEEISFAGLSNLDCWQPIGGLLLTSFPYDHIYLIVEYIGRHEIYLDNIQFYKSTLGSHYLYSNNGQLLNQGSGQSSIGVSLDGNGKNSAVLGKNGEYLIYEYDNQGRERNVSDSFGNVLNNEYVENGVIKTLSNNGIKIVTSTESINGLTTKKDELGYISKDVYDEFGNLVSSMDKNGNVIRRLYDDCFRPVLVERKTAFESLGKLQIEYTDLNNISSILVSDGTVYEFNYDDWGRRTSVTLDNINIESLIYASPLQFDKPVVVGKQIISDGTYNYSINYEDGNPAHILLNNSEIFTLKYDAFSRLVEWHDVRNDISGFLNYDYSGQIISETLDSGFSYRLEYDKLDNVQSKLIHLLNGTTLYSYLLPYEFNDLSLTGYAFDLANATNNDVVLGGFGTQGLFGLKTGSNQNLIINDPVTHFDVLSFYNKSPIKYLLSTINDKKTISGLKKNTIVQKQLSILSKKAISGWFYFDSSCITKTILAFEHNSSIQSRIILIGDTILALTAGETTRYISFNDGLFNKWIMITLNLYGPSAYGANYAQLFINNEEVCVINLEQASLNNLDKLIVGGGNTQETAANMKVAYLCVGEELFDAGLVDRIYKSSYRIFVNGNPGRYCGMTLISDSNSNYEYYSFNGTYLSSNGIKPLFVGKQKNSLNNGSNVFSWDDASKQQVYASFDTTYFLNDTSGSFLCYAFPIESNSFDVAVEYELIAISSEEKRTILALNNSSTNTEELSIYFEENLLKIKVLNSNNYTTNTICSIPSYQQWHKITIKHDNQSLSIYGDSNNLLLAINSLQSNLSNTSIYIGCNSNSEEQLNGYMRNLYLSGSGFDLLGISPNNFSLIKKIDSFGRTIQTSFVNVIQSYSYVVPKDENGIPLFTRTSLKVGSEIDSFNNETAYKYDANGNVTKITKNNDETILSYDMADRLLSVETSSNIKQFLYDQNGNILSIQKTQNQIVSSRIFTYDNCGKRLISIVEGNNEIEYQYSNNSFYPIVIGNILLFWEGSLLKEIDNGQDVYQYQYDYRNRRISKSTVDSVTHYYYDKDKLVAERTGNNTVYYHYDESLSVIGFTIKTSASSATYFYLKDILGIIHSIVDSNGQIVATYEYDEFGALLSSSGNQNIISKNHIIYKGYFYDEETGFYLLGHRYYYPYSCRFISPDDVDYLLANLLDYTQFNLFSYCNNNPIMLSDESGHLVFIITTVLALALPVLLAVSLAAPALGTTVINTTIVAASTAIAAVGAIEAFSVLVGIFDSAKKGLDWFDSIINVCDAIIDVFQILSETSCIGIGLGVSLLFKNSKGTDWCLSYFNNVLPSELRHLVEQHLSGLTLLSEFLHFTLTNPLCVAAAFCVNWVFGVVIGIIDTAYSLTVLISSASNYEHNKAIWNSCLYKYDENNTNKEPWPTIDSSNPYEEDFIDIVTFIDNFKIWINNQEADEFSDIKCGFSTIDKSGCGIIVAFNALQFVQGINISLFPDIIMKFEQKNLLFEKIGALPNEIEEFLNDTITFQQGTILSFNNKTAFFNAYDNCVGSKAIFSCHFNYSDQPTNAQATSFDQYLEMHYVLVHKNINDDNHYGLNDGNFVNKPLTKLWDDEDNLSNYRGFVHACIVKKNNN